MRSQLIKIFCSLGLGIVLLLCIISTNNETYAQNWELTYVNYTVQQSDKALWSIAERFATPNVYLPEYTESIIELNYDSLFYQREQQGQRGMIREGDVLKIPVWVK